MSRALWLQAVRRAWISYVRKMNNFMKPYGMERYLRQDLDMGMKLDEFAEAVFMEGFAAGEKHARVFMAGNRTCDATLN